MCLMHTDSLDAYYYHLMASLMMMLNAPCTVISPKDEVCLRLLKA